MSSRTWSRWRRYSICPRPVSRAGVHPGRVPAIRHASNISRQNSSYSVVSWASNRVPVSMVSPPVAPPSPAPAGWLEERRRPMRYTADGGSPGRSSPPPTAIRCTSPRASPIAGPPRAVLDPSIVIRNTVQPHVGFGGITAPLVSCAAGNVVGISRHADRLGTAGMGRNTCANQRPHLLLQSSAY